MRDMERPGSRRASCSHETWRASSDAMPTSPEGQFQSSCAQSNMLELPCILLLPEDVAAFKAFNASCASGLENL